MEKSIEMKRPLLCCAIFISVLFSTGCTTTVNKIQDLQQRAMISMRKPGEKMVASPEKTAMRYSCSGYLRGKLIVEEVDVIPDRVNPGGEINQRIRYALCPDVPPGIKSGKILRTVLFNGEPQFQDVTYYEFKPGTWTIDAFIDLPTDVEGGVYVAEVIITHGAEKVIRNPSFVVRGDK